MAIHHKHVALPADFRPNSGERGHIRLPSTAKMFAERSRACSSSTSAHVEGGRLKCCHCRLKLVEASSESEPCTMAQIRFVSADDGYLARELIAFNLLALCFKGSVLWFVATLLRQGVWREVESRADACQRSAASLLLGILWDPTAGGRCRLLRVHVRCETLPTQTLRTDIFRRVTPRIRSTFS